MKGLGCGLVVELGVEGVRTKVKRDEIEQGRFGFGACWDGAVLLAEIEVETRHRKTLLF